MSLRTAASLFAFAVLFTGCAVNVERDGDEGLSGDDEAAASTSDVFTFYRVRQDFRRCMFPMCGGIWYRQVNQATTTCVGGSRADWCYAATSDFDAAKVPELAAYAFSDQAVVRAKIDRTTINGSKWAKFVATEGWKAVTATAPPVESSYSDPRFYLLTDNGVRCFTTPCFSTDARRLNSTAKSRTVSDVDLTGIAAATSEQLDEARAALASGGLIAFGGFRTPGSSVVFAATQAYVKMAPVANYCTDDAQCGLGLYPTPVTKPSECYCPMCPRPVLASTQEANQKSWAKFCTGMKCPMVKCAAPPPVACVSNSCQYSPEL